jgi:uncharacterized protein
MQTAIGRQLRESRRDLLAATALTVLAIIADLALIWWNRGFGTSQERWALALVAFAAQVRLAGGDLPSTGLVLRPVQGWAYWARATLWIGLAVGALIALGLGAWVLAGGELIVYTVRPDEIGDSFVRMCVLAPLLEETLYRLVLCVPLAVALGPWGAIVVSGLAFGGLHVVYGNPSPENLAGGFFLAWAYLTSGTITVPLLLHGLGNLVVLAGHVGTWLWLAS